MRFFTTTVLTTLIAVFSQCQTAPPEIDRVHVEEVISTLAADDMQGRQTFSPGIEKASAFIQGEFEKAGLEKLSGLDSYAQSFAMYSLSPTSKRLVINGDEISVDTYFVSTNSRQINWSEADDVNIVNVGAEDNFRQAFGAADREGGKTMLVVDTSHSEIFGRFMQFLGRASRTMELTENTGLIAVMASDMEVQSLEATVDNNVEELALENVAGIIPGKRSNEIVLFSAHYDHIGIRPAVEGDSIANGANDDASGTTAVIALADYFNQMAQPERTLMFVAFTAEEMGGFGSRYFSQQLNPDEIVAMFNIEMIGKPAEEGPNTAWITGFDKSDFGAILQRAVDGTEYEFYADPYPTQNLFYRSDNATLARLGVPAHSISTTPILTDQDYHQVTDHVETLDLDHMTNTIKAIAAGATTIMSGAETPTRVDTSTID